MRIVKVFALAAGIVLGWLLFKEVFSILILPPWWIKVESALGPHLAKGVVLLVLLFGFLLAIGPAVRGVVEIFQGGDLKKTTTWDQKLEEELRGGERVVTTQRHEEHRPPH